MTVRKKSLMFSLQILFPPILLPETVLVLFVAVQVMNNDSHVLLRNWMFSSSPSSKPYILLNACLRERMN